MHAPLLIVAGRPTPSIVTFADELARLVPQTVLILSDSGFDDYPRAAQAIEIGDDEARDHGFFNSSPLIDKTPIAWDKAIYYLASGKIDFEHAWIMEDDVFFARPDLASQMIARYQDVTTDLLLNGFFRPAERPMWPHWYTARSFEPHHRAGGFLPLSRFSRRLIDHCGAFSQRNGSLCFIETMFPSLAVQHDLTVCVLDFLTERRFRFEPTFHTWELMQKLGPSLQQGVFHPVKSDQLRSFAMSKRLSWSDPATWDIALMKAFGPLDPIRVRRRLERMKLKIAPA